MDDSAVTESNGLLHTGSAAAARSANGCEQCMRCAHDEKLLRWAAVNESKKHIAGGDFVLWQVPRAGVN